MSAESKMRRFDVNFGAYTVEAVDHQKAAVAAARLLKKLLDSLDPIAVEVGDLAELNDPIHPFMSTVFYNATTETSVKV